MLQRIDRNQQRLEQRLDQHYLDSHSLIQDLRNKIEALHQEILHLVHSAKPFYSQEQEMKKLKAQLNSLEKGFAQNYPVLSPPMTTPMWSSPGRTYSPLPKASQPLPSQTQLESFERLFGSTSSYFTPEEYQKKVAPAPTQFSSFENPPPRITPPKPTASKSYQPKPPDPSSLAAQLMLSKLLEQNSSR